MLTVDNAVLWFAFKKMLPDSKFSDYVGRNEKTKVIFCSLSELLMRGHELVCLPPAGSELNEDDVCHRLIILILHP